MKVGALVSGGKDSIAALYKAKDEIACIIAVKSKNPDSYMFHVRNIELVKMQAEAMEKPIIIVDTEGKKEKELSLPKISARKTPFCILLTVAISFCESENASSL